MKAVLNDDSAVCSADLAFPRSAALKMELQAERRSKAADPQKRGSALQLRVSSARFLKEGSVFLLFHLYGGVIETIGFFPTIRSHESSDEWQVTKMQEPPGTRASSNLTGR